MSKGCSILSWIFFSFLFFDFGGKLKLFLTEHSQSRIVHRMTIHSFIDSLIQIYFGDSSFEVIENKKSKDFTSIKNPDCHKIRVKNNVLVFSNDMKALLTVNPCELSKLKKRRTQGYLSELKKMKGLKCI